LCRNSLLQRVIEGKKKYGIEVRGRRGKRCKKIMNDIKERRRYSHLMKENLDHSKCRAGFGRGVLPVVRQNTKWMSLIMYAKSDMKGYGHISLNYFKIRNFIEKFAEQFKTYILFSVTFSETGRVLRKCVQFCTDRQTIDSNVTGCMVIAYCIIKYTDTNWYGDKKMCTVLYR
jgi:hypothetical protein